MCENTFIDFTSFGAFIIDIVTSFLCALYDDNITVTDQRKENVRTNKIRLHTNSY